VINNYPETHPGHPSLFLSEPYICLVGHPLVWEEMVAVVYLRSPTLLHSYLELSGFIVCSHSTPSLVLPPLKLCRTCD
jgi:hypothetical protein